MVPARRVPLWAVVAVAIVGGVAAATLSSVVARSTDLHQVASNDFTTASSFPSSCTEARVNDVQRGTVTNSQNTPQTITLPQAVDPSRAFLLFTSRHGSDKPNQFLVRGKLASSTTIEFTRVSNGSVPSITIDWSVVEYQCGVKVQRGETALSSSSSVTDQPITAVSGTDRAFVTASLTSDGGDTTYDNADTVVSDLQSTTNVQFRAGAASAGKVVSWQVVELLSPVEVSVQRVSAAITAGNTQGTATLPVAVDPNKTFVVSSFAVGGDGGPDVGSRLVTAELTNSTTVTVRRDASGSNDTVPEVRVQVVELRDGSVVRRGSSSVGSGTTTVKPTLPAVDLRRASAFTTVGNGSGQSSGRSAYTSSSVPGISSFTATLASGSNGLTLQRASTPGDASVIWQVVEWGQP